ncbi:S8 family peptidase [Streptomyces aureoverticillatus]|uniref:S8 family peptidase n=1 Tax=Streptomyces aureoverticillatus TaxID=66871 RepID=UPI0013DC8CFD|nr:S8 family peptidase [Streptomyces aureoverticillatus]QIB43889.1 S8 family peptidase [Streptomyces aureoverticillatus]
MRQHRKKAYAVGIAVALGAGVVGPASAGTDGGADSRGPGRAPAQAGPPHRAQLGPAHRLTLVTGDRVTVDSKGRMLGFTPAKGRERIPVSTRTVRGHALVLPYDAERLIAEGKVDQRLFDVTELTSKANRKAQGKGLKLIVGYKGTARGAKAGVRAAGDTAVRRTFSSLNADAVTTPRKDAAALWKTITGGKRGKRGVASGVSHVWLDGTRKASLDKSVKQIGAPKAWQAGLDGKGVRIAVLDSGVDATHPDLKGRIADEKNFTASPDTKDRVGHGTHVASTAAGTGAKSGGRFKGVAPGAEVLSGKVLGDDGYGSDSQVIAGMEWAAAQGADVVNLSLGGDDSVGVDPLEDAVNKLSADKGVLFAVAAGNEGHRGSVGSPGSADAALTVGAVDGKDKLADFSSEGPRVGDGAIKPDVTAPGVDITAAAAPGSEMEKELGQKPEGYLTASGTSMATPHVAGAAALLKQRHPDWKAAELKRALTSSAKAGKYTPYQQGSGRIAVDKAVDQTVVADPVSLNFGAPKWPHTDDKPVARKVTYRNLGTKDVTLDLSVTATDPKGRPAPHGFYTLGAKKVTVPAGGRATVGLTAHTKLGGSGRGTYSAYVVAKGGGQTVRTGAVVQRDGESYDVTLKYIGRDGRPAKYFSSGLFGLTGPAAEELFFLSDVSGTVKIRVPKGGYYLDTQIYGDPDDTAKGVDWLARPRLNVTKDMTLKLDARVAKPVDITVPDKDAKQVLAYPQYVVREGLQEGVFVKSYAHLRTAHLGPEVTDGSLVQQWSGSWVKGDDEQYDILVGGKVERLATGYAKHFKDSELATVNARLGASADGKKAVATPTGWLPDGSGRGSGWSVPQQALSTRKFHLSTADKVQWDTDVDQVMEDEDGGLTSEATYLVHPPATYKAGRTYTRTFNTAVFGPRIGGDLGIYREGNDITGSLPVVADGDGHEGESDFSSVRTTLHRDGRKIGENKDPLTGGEPFKVPAEDAEYRLSTSVRRDPRVAPVSSRVDASWTFRSKKVRKETLLPASTVRFTPKVGLDSRAPAGATRSVPVTVQGAAAGENLKSLSAYVSYDKGRTWKKAAVRDGKISVTNPARGKSISFRAAAEDKKGNKATVAIYDAYFGK